MIDFHGKLLHSSSPPPFFVFFEKEEEEMGYRELQVSISNCSLLSFIFSFLNTGKVHTRKCT